MTTADTSVLVAGFSAEHEFHESVQPHLAEVLGQGRLISHTIAETYSVLSSPSGVFRAEPSAVAQYLNQFTEARKPIEIGSGLYLEAVERLADQGRGGGMIFDAVIALGARESNSTLVTVDRRALPVYEACGTVVRMIGNAS